MRQSTMTTLPVNVDVKCISCAHDRTITEGSASYRNLAPDMKGNEARAFFDERIFFHVVGPAVINFFFCRLEEKTNCDGKLIFHLCKYFSRSKKNCNMSIVTACMHSSFVFGFIFAGPKFGNRQGINVCTNSQNLIRRVRPLDGSNHARFCGFHIGNPQFFQVVDDISLGFKFMPRLFGMCMQVAPNFYQFILNTFNFFLYIHLIFLLTGIRMDHN